MNIAELNFKKIPNTNYYIDKNGIIIRKFKNGKTKKIKTSLGKNGYKSFYCGNKKEMYIHRALAICLFLIWKTKNMLTILIEIE